MANAKILCGVVVLWLGGSVLIANIPALQNFGYLIFMSCEVAAPLTVTWILYLRNWRAAKTQNIGSELWRVHLTFFPLMVITALRGYSTKEWYLAMDDAPRGLLWDLYIAESLVEGLIYYWTLKGLFLLGRKLAQGVWTSPRNPG